MAICSFCGCKTDELDFVQVKIENEEIKVCSFCEKQIKKIDSEEKIAPAQLRWLESVASKEVEREAEVIRVIDSLKTKYLPEAEPSEYITAPQKQIVAPKKETGARLGVGDTGISAEQYTSLLKRVEALEVSFKKYKKLQQIKMIIEFGIPVLIAILIAIIFFSSGLYDMLTTFLSQ